MPDLSNMSPLEIGLTLLLLMLGNGMRIWAAANKSKLSAEDQTRFEKVSAMAISSAEEMGKRDGWTGAEKLSYAQELVKAGFPKLNTDYVDAGIHAALAIVEIGNSGATAIRNGKPVVRPAKEI